jgi:hypothetical protein
MTIKAQISKLARQPLFWVYAVMRRFSTWYQKVTCKHTVLTFERIDYQDRYVKCKCDKCGEDVYKDI